jgi:threonine dehydratase
VNAPRAARLVRLARLRVEIPDRPGALAGITAILAEAGVKVEEIEHNRLFGSLSAERAEVEAVVQTRGEAHMGALLERLAAAGLRCTRG